MIVSCDRRNLWISLGGVSVLSEEGLRQSASHARLPIAHGGLGLLSTTVLAPIAFVGQQSIV